MSLLYKPDWEETKRRYQAWWAHEALDRCGLAVWAPRADKPCEPAPVARDPVQKWTDLDFIARANDHYLRSTFYGGEAFPVWNAGYAGHAGMCTFLGCSITTDMSTGWIDPILTAADSDGCAMQLVPLLAECGFDALYPFEAKGKNDLVLLRTNHPKFIFFGNLEKEVVNEGNERLIEPEIMSKVPRLLMQGGYFPNGDHGIQPLVTFPNLCRFMTILHEVCHNPEGEFPRW